MTKYFLPIFILIISSSCQRAPSELTFKSRDDLVRGNPLMKGTAPLNFNSLKNYILKPKCMSCHSGPNAEPNNDPIDFSTYEATMIDRFIPLLVKGKPEKSRLFLTVEKGEMPVDGTLTAVEVEFIKKWIEACAPKDVTTSIPNNCDSNDDDEPGDDDDEPGDGEPGDDDESGDDEP